MSFKTENRKLSNIFEGQKTYYVPRYQRKYVWTKTNWSELLADIKFTISEGNNEMNWSHFLGTIVLNKKNTHTLGIEEFEIIDGQQRLTTTFVIFIAICARLQILGEDEHQALAKNIINTYIQVTKLNGEKQYKFVNELYKPEFDIILQAALDKTHVIDNSPIKDLYNYYCYEFSNYDFNMIKKFFEKLLSISIVEIISEEDEEIYNIFEVLNARGQKLKQLELLKNRIMKYITPRDTDVIDKAKQDWLIIEENLINIPDTDVFLHHFVKCYIKKQPENKSSVYKLIKENIKIEDIKTLLENLKKYSDSYKIISSKNNENHYIKYFDIKRNQQIRCVLAALHQKLLLDFNDTELYNNVLKQLRNYFFIFNLTKQTSNKIDSIITEYAYKIYNSIELVELKIQISAMFYMLNNYISSISSLDEYLLTNPTLKYSNNSKSGFTRNAKFIRYVLYEIYRQSETDTQINYEELTIEHIYSDSGDEETSCISNLTLLTKDLNESLKNKSPKEKLEKIKEASTIEENKQLIHFLKDDKFNLEERTTWFSERILSGNLSFNPNILNFSKADVERYNKTFELIKNDAALVKLLKKYGKKFEDKIRMDPNLTEEYSRFIALI